MDINKVNQYLRDKSPEEIIAWALERAKQPIVTTNFRPGAQLMIHAVTSQAPNIPVIWVDSGYNTSYTYRHALDTIRRFDLNIDIFAPKMTAGFRDIVMGIPDPDTPEHQEFTNEVKLEPFKRALSIYEPDVWFTNIRKGQTKFRDTLDIVTLTNDGVLKISPFYHWDDEQVNDYMDKHDLDSEDRYYDPTKVFANRECGLHKL